MRQVALPGSHVGALPKGVGAPSLVFNASVSPRHALRAIASEPGAARVALARLQEVRALVDYEHERLLGLAQEEGASLEAYQRGHARLVDGLVLGLAHLARVCVDRRSHRIVAPVAIVALGGYGRAHLPHGAPVDLLFLLGGTDEDQSRAVCMAAFVIAGLRALGVEVREILRTSRERPAALVGSAPRADADHRRFLWGCYGLYARLVDGLDAARQGAELDRPSARAIQGRRAEAPLVS